MNLLALLIAGSVSASALLTLDGKIDRTTKTHYIVQVRNRYFHVRKNALSEAQLEHFKKYDAKVNGAVPMESIEAVTDNPDPLDANVQATSLEEKAQPKH